MAATAKVGDTVTSATGNTAIVKSLSGTSSRCQAPALPIRALLQFNYSFSSKAGIELPDGFKAKEISATQTFNGLLLSAHDTSKSIGVSVAAQPHKQGGDGGALAKNIATRLLTAVEDGVTSNEEELSVGGLSAVQIEDNTKLTDRLIVVVLLKGCHYSKPTRVEKWTKRLRRKLSV